jgi:hypothetical protein
MDAEISAARQARTQYRHDLRTLTYVTLDQANGGIVRNLTHDGIGVQAVVALRPRQQMRVRFELRYPRVRVETRGEVVWSTFSGQCGIRFLDMQPRVTRQIDEWIFGNLLEGATLHPERAGPIFAEVAIEDDGLLLSAAPRKIIELPLRPESEATESEEDAPQATDRATELDWLSQPLSGRTLAWTVDTLAVFAAVLLFALVFPSVTRETPRWPWAMAAGAVMMVVVLYWGFFRMFGGSSLGARLARMAGDEEDEEVDARFR